MLNEAGVPCGVLMAPIVPGISDSPAQLRSTVEAIAEAGAKFLSPLVLHLRPGVKEEFIPWLEENHPDLVENYEHIYRKRSHAPKDVQEPITKAVGNLKREFGYLDVEHRRQRRGGKEPSEDQEPESEQLSLALDDKSARSAPKWVSETINHQSRR